MNRPLIVLLCALAACVPLGAARAAGAPPLVAYEDPGKHFTLEYPRGWQVKRFPSGATAFYSDDPQEGSAFWVTPALVLKGELTATQAMGVLLDGIRKTYPDLKVVGARQKPGSRAGQSFVEVAVTWTNSRHVPMKGWANLGAMKMTGEGRTVASAVSYQAPAREFDQTELLFGRMLKSLHYQR